MHVRFTLHTFLWRSRPDNDVNSPNLRLCGGREHLPINFQFLFKWPHRLEQFHFCNVDTHFPCRAIWSNGKIITITPGNYTFRHRSRNRLRHTCLNFLMSESYVERDLRRHENESTKAKCWVKWLCEERQENGTTSKSCSNGDIILSLDLDRREYWISILSDTVPKCRWINVRQTNGF